MSLKYFVLEALRQAWRQRLLTLVAVSALGMAALFAGAWGLLWRNAQHWSSSVGDAAEIVAYLRPGLSAAAQGGAVDAARQLSGVASVSLVSEAEAAQQLSRDPQLRQALELLGENPLPATLRIRLGGTDVAAAQSVAASLAELNGVEEVDSGDGAVESLLKANRAVRTALLGLGGLFSAAALLIVAAVLRLAAWSRRQELGIMRLVGASHGFIRAPFWLEGLLQGLLGGCLAAAALGGSLSWLALRLRAELQVDLAAFVPLGVDLPFALSLLAGTAVLGLVGAGLGLATVTLAYEDEDSL